MKNNKHQHLLMAIKLGLYSADKNGNVYSHIKRGQWRWRRDKEKKSICCEDKRLLKMQHGPNRSCLYGAYQIQLNGVGKRILAHHIVWIYFNRDFDYHLTVNHKNRKKLDNRLCNLEAVSFKENLKHYIKNGGRKNRIITPQIKKKILKWLATGKSGLWISHKTKICPQTISHIKLNKQYKHI